MGTQANIVAFDGAVAPVSHTFIPVTNSTVNGETVASWRESIGGIPLNAQPTVTLRRRKLKSQVEQVSLSVSVPVMEAVTNQNAAGYTAAPKIAYVNTYTLTGYFSERASITDRRLARMLLVNIANNISTSVAAATAGPASEAFDAAVSPV